MRCFAGFGGKGRAGIVTIVVFGCLLALSPVAANAAAPGNDSGGDTPPMLPASPVADSGNSAAGEEALAMFQLINDLRVKGGSCLGKPMKAAPPLAFNSILQVAAEKDTADAAGKGGFGTAPGLSQGGIKGTESYPGAKVAKLFGIADPPASTMIDVWKIRPRLCEVLLSSEYDDIGVAYNERYWVVIMGQRSKGVPSPEIPASRQKQTTTP